MFIISLNTCGTEVPLRVSSLLYITIRLYYREFNTGAKVNASAPFCKAHWGYCASALVRFRHNNHLVRGLGKHHMYKYTKGNLEGQVGVRWLVICCTAVWLKTIIATSKLRLQSERLCCCMSASLLSLCVSFLYSLFCCWEMGSEMLKGEQTDTHRYIYNLFWLFTWWLFVTHCENLILDLIFLWKKLLNLWTRIVTYNWDVWPGERHDQQGHLKKTQNLSANRFLLKRLVQKISLCFQVKVINQCAFLAGFSEPSRGVMVLLLLCAGWILQGYNVSEHFILSKNRMGGYKSSNVNFPKWK